MRLPALSSCLKYNSPRGYPCCDSNRCVEPGSEFILHREGAATGFWSVYVRRCLSRTRRRAI